LTHKSAVFRIGKVQQNTLSTEVNFRAQKHLRCSTQENTTVRQHLQMHQQMLFHVSGGASCRQFGGNCWQLVLLLTALGRACQQLMRLSTV